MLLAQTNRAIVKDGWAAYNKGKYEEALSLFEGKAEAAKAKGNGAALDGRGWALLALDRPKEARAAFKEAIALDKEFFYSKSGLIASGRALMTSYNRAWSLIRLGRYEEATENLTRAEVSSDLKWLIDDAMAWISYYRGEHDAAAEAFNRIIAENKNAYSSMTGLGLIALEKGNYKKAVGHLSDSFTLSPYQALNTYVSSAKRFVDAGQFNEAKEILKKGEAVYPYLSLIHI